MIYRAALKAWGVVYILLGSLRPEDTWWSWQKNECWKRWFWQMVQWLIVNGDSDRITGDWFIQGLRRRRSPCTGQKWNFLQWKNEGNVQNRAGFAKHFPRCRGDSALSCTFYIIYSFQFFIVLCILYRMSFLAMNTVMIFTCTGVTCTRFMAWFIDYFQHSCKLLADAAYSCQYGNEKR